jgi:hypothetical protein
MFTLSLYHWPLERHKIDTIGDKSAANCRVGSQHPILSCEFIEFNLDIYL